MTVTHSDIERARRPEPRRRSARAAEQLFPTRTPCTLFPSITGVKWDISERHSYPVHFTDPGRVLKYVWSD